MHVPRFIELLLIHLFWEFLTYLVSFETNTALKVAIKYFYLTSTLSSDLLVLLNPCPRAHMFKQRRSGSILQYCACREYLSGARV